MTGCAAVVEWSADDGDIVDAAPVDREVHVKQSRLALLHRNLSQCLAHVGLQRGAHGVCANAGRTHVDARQVGGRVALGPAGQRGGGQQQGWAAPCG